jgi:hypothetical protein
MTAWHYIKTAPEGEEVWTKLDDEHGERNMQKLTRHGRLWWIYKNGVRVMYVYYTPTHWSRDNEGS